MSDVTVTISGLDELEKALEAIDDKLATKYVREAVREGGKVVKAEMVTMAPRGETGLLAEHFDVRTGKTKGEPRAVSAYIGPNSREIIHTQSGGKTSGLPRTAAFISRLLEFGSIRMPKHPFLTAAWEACKGRALDRMLEVLRNRLQD